MKLHIVGASGSGVTTLGKALGEALGVRYFDSDEYFWVVSEPPFTKRRPAYARNAALSQELSQQPRWILGGSLVGWGDQWLTAFDLVIFLWLPPALRLSRLQQREQERYGSKIATEPARAAQYHAFLAWAAGYDDNSSGGHRTLANHNSWLTQVTCPVLELRGDLSVEQRLQLVGHKLIELGWH
ncbi:adenylate kinase [Hymenobacter cellulosilyticus]|uniref:Adenylate kinase n=1 Tax=Hymenobacter cellulosilyticus TaxID=2932248 RepID=A0A8T9Q0T1_9BACT|nr:adenylate kinase [Hymenobacter cellulosilyticus]UOQ71386.1 adenylate kinase [Hymenobacter cellulosilyticus]